jgi:VanZ family protein
VDEPFAIERWAQDLVVAGWFRDAQGNTSSQRLFCGHIFASQAARFVTVTSGPEGTKVYLEGVEQRSYPGLVLVAENFDGTLLLGQSSTGHQEWRGDIAGLAIYTRALAPKEVVDDYRLWSDGDFGRLRVRAPETAIYPFNERTGAVVHNQGNMGGDLEIPKELRASHPVLLKGPNHRGLADLSDITLNVLGFIPFSALLAIYLYAGREYSKGRLVTISILAGVAISLIIEVLQVCLPSRDSSLLDLIMNALGSGIGAMLGVSLSPRLLRMQLPATGDGCGNWREV